MSTHLRPALILLGGLLALLGLLAFDVAGCHSRYLYLCTEIILLLVIAGLYWYTFHRLGGEAPLAGSDRRPALRRFTLFFVLLALTVLVIWALDGWRQGQALTTWLHRGKWFLFNFAVFVLTILLVGPRLRRVNLTALYLTVLITVPVLSGFELVLLARGTGWAYRGTVIAWVGGLPLENLVFIYPLAPALAIFLYTLVDRRWPGAKGFWVSTAILLPTGVAAELIGLYPLDIWEVYQAQSILPLGRTNLEEIVYYSAFQQWSILVYALLIRLLRPTAEEP